MSPSPRTIDRRALTIASVAAVTCVVCVFLAMNADVGGHRTWAFALGTLASLAIGVTQYFTVQVALGHMSPDMPERPRRYFALALAALVGALVFIVLVIMLLRFW